MEYSYDELPKGIYYLLSVYPNKKFTVEELYQTIRDEKVCPELFRQPPYTRNCNLDYIQNCNLDYIRNCCSTVSKDFRNVEWNGTTCMLRHRLWTVNDIENIVQNPQQYPNVNFDKPYSEGQTIPHILCMEGYVKLLEELTQRVEFNPFVKNEYGQTLIDVISENNTDKILYKIIVKQMKKYHDNVVVELNKKNTNLVERNSDLHIELFSLRKREEELNHRLYTVYGIWFVVFVGYIAHIVFNVYTVLLK